MAVKFFFGAEGASIAFQKIQDFADWSSTAYEANAETNWNVPPSAFTDARVLAVSNLAGAIAVFKRSDGGATFDFRIVGGVASANFVDVFFTVDGGKYETQDEDLLIAISTTGLDYVAVVIDSLSSGTLEAELAPVPFETTE